ncbi:MAG: hypothetical protein ABI165_09535 [Bryobacteraceae bacterium]
MDALLERLDRKLREWKLETIEHVRHRVSEIIDLADQDTLGVSRRRRVEQETLELLDERPSK